MGEFPGWEVASLGVGDLFFYLAWTLILRRPGRARFWEEV